MFIPAEELPPCGGASSASRVSQHVPHRRLHTTHPGVRGRAMHSDPLPVCESMCSTCSHSTGSPSGPRPARPTPGAHHIGAHATLLACLWSCRVHTPTGKQGLAQWCRGSAVGLIRITAASVPMLSVSPLPVRVTCSHGTGCTIWTRTNSPDGTRFSERTRWP